MDSVVELNKVWGIVSWLLMLAFAFGGLAMVVRFQGKAINDANVIREKQWKEQRAINQRLFDYHDEQQKEIKEVLLSIRDGGIAVHQCPMAPNPRNEL